MKFIVPNISIQQNGKLLPCIVIFLMLIFTGRDIGGMGINPYLTTLLICCGAIMLPYSYLVSYAAFMLPLSCGIQSFSWIAILGCLLYRGKKVSTATIIMFFIVFLMELIGILQYDSNNMIVKNIVFYFVSFFLVIYLTMNNNENVDNNRNIRYFIYGTSFLFAMIFGRNILTLGIDEIFAGALRYSMDDKSLKDAYVFFTNANNLGLYSSVCFATLLLGAKRLEMPTICYIVSMILIICGGAFSLSRTWLITSVLSLIFFLFFSPKNKTYISVVIVCGILALVAFNMALLDPLYEMFNERLSGDDIKTGAGRTDLFAAYNTFFFTHPQYWLTGTGSVHYLGVCNQQNSMHNMLQQIYVCYGLIGAITFFTFFFNIYKSNKKYVKLFMQYLPLIIYLIFSQTVQIVNPIYCIYPLVLTVFCMQMYKNES